MTSATKTGTAEEVKNKNWVSVILAAMICFISPALSFAGPFTTGTTALRADLLNILLPVASIACIVVGVLAWMGKISWYWLVGLVIGTILVFGSDQVVTWIRSLAGV